MAVTGGARGLRNTPILGRLIGVALAGCTLLTPLACGQPSPGDGLDQARIQQSWPTLTERSIPAIPPSITSAEINRYGDLLELSEAQRQYLNFFFNQYQDRCRETEETFGKAVREAAAAIAEHPKPITQPEYFGAESAVLTARADFTEAVHDLDQSLLNQLQEILAEPQKPMIRRVLMHRERSASLTVFGNIKIGKTHVDLSRMIESKRFGEDISPDLDAVMQDYEERLTPLRVRLDAESRIISAKYSRLKMNLHVNDQGIAWDKADPEVSARVTREWQEGIIDSRKESVKLQTEIASLNDEFLLKFVAALSERDGEHFRKAYSSRVYGRVYPDFMDPRPIYDMVLVKIPEDSELRLVVVQRWTEYQQVVESLNDKMCKATDAWQEEGARSDSTDRWADHDSLMLQLAHQRLGKHEEFVKWLESAIPPDILTEAQREIDRWQARLAASQQYERDLERQGRPRYISWE